MSVVLPRSAWAGHIPTDIVSPDADLSAYDLVIAPVLYMVKAGIAEKLEAFTRERRDICHNILQRHRGRKRFGAYLGGYPGPLRSLLGLWSEEIDALTPAQSNTVVFETPFGNLSGPHPCRLLCDRIHPEGASVLAVYGNDFYAGEPAVTVNTFGQGRAYYLATALDGDALTAFLQKLCTDKGIAPPLPNVPAGVEVLPRVSPTGETLLYVLNHTPHPVTLPLPDGAYTDLLTNHALSGQADLDGCGVLILVRQAV